MHQAEEDAARVVQSAISGTRARRKCVKKLAAYEEQQACIRERSKCTPKSNPILVLKAALKRRQQEREEYVRMLMESSPQNSPKSTRSRSASKEVGSPF